MFHSKVSWMLLCGSAALACSAKNDNTETTLASTEPADGTPTSGDSSHGPAGSTGDGLACTWDEPQAACEAKAATCLYRPAAELTWGAGACTPAPDPVGWCVDTPTGQTDAPSWWYEAATGRVIVFPVGPFVGAPGWERCSCAAPAPQACMCADECGSGEDASTSSAG